MDNSDLQSSMCRASFPIRINDRISVCQSAVLFKGQSINSSQDEENSQSVVKRNVFIVKAFSYFSQDAKASPCFKHYTEGEEKPVEEVLQVKMITGPGVSGKGRRAGRPSSGAGCGPNARRCPLALLPLSCAPHNHKQRPHTTGR